MSDTQFGMNPAPMRSHSLASRCVCAKCGTEPSILEADGLNVVNFVVACHGEKERKTMTREEMQKGFTIVCFQPQE